tara:strand:+ start:3458 stop:4057 length:600 start_codon:yes stop_codon:yes gene_type:complete
MIFKFSIILFFFINVIFAGGLNTRFGAGLDVGSRGSGIFLNYLYGNNKKNIDIIGEVRYFDIKGETESIVYDNWTNQYITISGQNLLFIPALVGFNYHPFAGKIANNFSPFVTIRGGLNLSIDGREGDGSYKKIWRKAETQWSPIAFFGGGVEFRWYNQSSVALHIGADIIKLKKEADQKKDYSGLLIHISFNRFIQNK